MKIDLSLLLGDAWFEAPQQVHPADAFDHTPALEHDRQVNVRATPHKSFGHDADNSADLVIQPELPSDYRRVAAKLPLPEPVTKNDYRGGVGRSIRRSIGAPEEGRYPHHLKGVERAAISSQSLRVPVAGPEHV